MEMVQAYRFALSQAPAQENNLTEWEAWADGDVYFCTLDKAVTWTTDDGHVDEEMTTCEADACHGYSGDEYAKEAALESWTTTHPESKEA